MYNCERTCGLVREVQRLRGYIKWNLKMHGLDESNLEMKHDHNRVTDLILYGQLQQFLRWNGTNSAKSVPEQAKIFIGFGRNNDGGRKGNILWENNTKILVTGWHHYWWSIYTIKIIFIKIMFIKLEKYHYYDDYYCCHKIIIINGSATPEEPLDLCAQEFRYTLAIRYKKPLLNVPALCNGCGSSFYPIINTLM